MKRYVWTITLPEGSDEFWEGLNRDGQTGVDELTNELREHLPQGWFDAEVKLVEYQDK